MTVPQEVKIPVKCDVPERGRPLIDPQNVVTAISNLLGYVEGLERDLAYCKGK